MDRRGFLKSILAAAVAPWVITKAGVLMRGHGVIVPPVLSWGPPVDHQVDALRYMMGGWTGGKSWFSAQEAVRRARLGQRVAAISNSHDMLPLFELVSAPLAVPTNIEFIRLTKGAKTE